MRCNACWRELEGRAVTTTCGHLLCPEDASKILNNDGACPICDQVLSKSHMKPMDINPNDEWVNMVMAGISPQILMKSAYRSVMFYIGQKDLEMQAKMNKIVTQYRQKCEAMQEKFTEKMEQIHTAYQKMAKRCQMMEQEMDKLSKEKQEIQEKFSEKCRQKRKLDELYDQARNEIESLKRSAIQPVNNFFPRREPDFFTNPATRLDNRDSIRRDWSVPAPDTPGPRDDVWPERQKNSNPTFDLSGSSPAKQSSAPMDTRNRMPNNVHPYFGVGSGAGGNNPSSTLKNIIFSPIKRPQLSRTRTQFF
ncbi:hypothetical protein ACJIZ3_011221 [Penstemon smallii]|uniref:RING-type domain-containing protein n=1 Tax=Penstemon smallii TaxID=265156 RepID=A0ABD3UIJ7_9LAMI